MNANVYTLVFFFGGWSWFNKKIDKIPQPRFLKAYCQLELMNE